jgi:hypothetical protein
LSSEETDTEGPGAADHSGGSCMDIQETIDTAVVIYIFSISHVHYLIMLFHRFVSRYRIMKMLLLAVNACHRKKQNAWEQTTVVVTA